jgi:hypothetical protein
MSCEKTDANQSTTPKRPAEVPARAEWAGGADGGAWIDCQWGTGQRGRTLECTIWLETGAREVEAEFELDDKSEPSSTLPSCYKFFDGSAIVTCDGRSFEMNRETAVFPALEDQSD